MKSNAHQWDSREWNTNAGRMTLWLKRALRPNASALSIGAAKCFYSIAMQSLGEVEVRRVLAEAEIALPEWLKDIPPARDWVKLQRAEKSARQALAKAA